MSEPHLEPAEVAVPRVQHRLWLADQLTPTRTVYLSSSFLRLGGRLNIDALSYALRRTLERHEVLRTSICQRGGEVVGLLRPVSEFRLDVQAIPEDRLEERILAESTQPLDISAGMPLRASLLQLGQDDAVLCLTVHHLAYDRGSVAIMYRSLTENYAGFLQAAGEPRPAGEHPAGESRPDEQFRALALREDARHDAGAFEPLLAQRRAALAGLSPVEIAGDRTRPAVRSGAGSMRRGFWLPEGTSRQLAEFAQARAASLYMVLLAGCQMLLYRYTGRSDVTTGMSAALRLDPASTELIGPFFNMLVLPGDVSDNPNLIELLGRVREAAIYAYDSRSLAFDTLVTELQVERDPARTPLFQILIDFTTDLQLPELAELEISEIPTPGSGAKYDLTIEFHQDGDRIGYSVEWDTALYEAETVLRLMRHLRTVLVTAADDPALPVDELPLLDPAELTELIEQPVAVPSSSCLHELFADQVVRTPEAVAIVDGAQALSYAELDRRSTALAHGLLARHAVAEDRVGVLLERSADLVVALLGILKSGCAYLPIDPELPPERMRTLLGTARAPLCIVPDGAATDGIDAVHARAIVAEAGSVPLDVASLLRDSGGTLELPRVRPEQLCAVYFTSGSTGSPKGVSCTHHGWVGQLIDMQRQYPLAAGDAVLLKTPLSFDDVAREIFWPLMLGGQVVVLGPGLHRDPLALINAAIRHQVVWLQFVPSMLALFLEQVRPEHRDRLGALRHVVSDGDRLRPQTVREFADRLGGSGCLLHNQWGTTEVSIDSTHHLCTPADGDGEDAVVLGRPMSHHRVYVLDAALRPVPRGAVGELCLGGSGLGRGYLDDPGRTARLFVPDPWHPGERIYRTGDTGRMLADGSLQYRGRRDHQVKIRGIRIELGEVEAALRSIPGVLDSTVGTWEPAPGDRRLVAYACLDPQLVTGPTRASLRDLLADRLPPAAVPNAIVLLDELPRMPSGKIDRRSLPAPDPGARSDEPFVAPATDTERALAGIWATVLGVSSLGAHDDFFAVGGHSLLVTRAVNRMRDAFAVEVPVRLIFEHSTVRRAAGQLEQLVLAEIEAMSDAEVEQLIATEIRRPQEVTDVRAH